MAKPKTTVISASPFSRRQMSRQQQLEAIIGEISSLAESSFLTVPIQILHSWRSDGSLVGLDSNVTSDPQYLSQSGSFFVQSVLLGFPVLSVLVFDGADNKLTILDGSDSLLSVFRFIDGWRVHKSDIFPLLADMTFKDMPVRLRESFLRFPVPVRSIRSTDSGVESFLRHAGF